MRFVTTDNATLRTEVIATVDQIPRSDWDRLFGDLAEGYDFYRVLEQSKLEGFSFAYALVHLNGHIALIAPIFLADFDLVIGVDGLPGRLIRMGRRVYPRLLRARTLFCGSPFGEQGALGVADVANPTALIKSLVGILEELCREKGLRFILFKDYSRATSRLLRSLETMGFMRGESFPNVVVDLPFATMDAYLASLTAGTRRNLRRKVRQAHAAGRIKVTETQDVSAVIDEIYALYLKTYDAGTIHFEKLTPQYFIEVSRRMTDSTRFFLYYFEGRLICFNLCFLHGDHLIDKFLGMDYSVTRKINLYDYTWSHNIQWCLARGVRHYQVGQTDYADKLRLGGRLLPLGYHARHLNPLANLVLKGMARLITPVATATAEAQSGSCGQADQTLPEGGRSI